MCPAGARRRAGRAARRLRPRPWAAPEPAQGGEDGHPFRSSFVALDDGTHELPVAAEVRRAIGKEAGETVTVHLEERLG
jgi:hypothetical protein